MAARGSIRSRSRARDGVVTLESGVVVTLKKTALHAEHVRLGAKLVDFAGWDMPIQYASQLDEHHAVRQAAGMFDVSSEEHTSELQSLMRISYAVFCLKKKNTIKDTH